MTLDLFKEQVLRELAILQRPKAKNMNELITNKTTWMGLK